MAEEVEGLGELLRTLKALPREIASVEGGPVLFGLRKAGRVFLKAAQENIDRIVAEPNKGNRPSVSTETLKGALYVGRDRNPQRSGANERVLVRLRKKNAPNGASVHAYGGMLEFGNEHVAAKPWMRPVVPEKSAEAVNVFISEARKKIDRAVKKARRK